MDKIQLCVIQVKYSACSSNRVTGVKCDISIFLEVFCSVVKFVQPGVWLVTDANDITVLIWKFYVILSPDVSTVL